MRSWRDGRRRGASRLLGPPAGAGRPYDPAVEFEAPHAQPTSRCAAPAARRRAAHRARRRGRWHGRAPGQALQPRRPALARRPCGRAAAAGAPRRRRLGPVGGGRRRLRRCTGPRLAARARPRDGQFSDPVWAGDADAVAVPPPRPWTGARPATALRQHQGHRDRARPAALARARRRQRARAGRLAGRRTQRRAAGTRRRSSRASNGAPTSARRAPTPAYGAVKLAFIHHTVSANDYGPQDSAAMVLGICRYHRNSNGWNDIGYNFLVDRYGTIFEGRAGGIDQAVVGAQAQGYNSQSTGIASLGTFSTDGQTDAGLGAIARLLGWKLAVHGVPPTGTVDVVSGGGSLNRYPAGRTCSSSASPATATATRPAARATACTPSCRGCGRWSPALPRPAIARVSLAVGAAADHLPGQGRAVGLAGRTGRRRTRGSPGRDPDRCVAPDAGPPCRAIKTDSAGTYRTRVRLVVQPPRARLLRGRAGSRSDAFHPSRHRRAAPGHGQPRDYRRRGLAQNGPTVADRIAKGPIPVEEALSIARQIAEALDVAHDHSIIHRDLKPANIKLRTDGTVKVLDFGLARLASDQVSGAGEGSGLHSQSPTLTSPAAMTRAGAILGTPAYMSPEQARGKTVDKRTDVWAFGCLLFEMLTGSAAFAGETLSGRCDRRHSGARAAVDGAARGNTGQCPPSCSTVSREESQAPPARYCRCAASRSTTRLRRPRRSPRQPQTHPGPGVGYRGR